MQFVDVKWDRATHENAVPKPAMKKYRTSLRKAATEGSVMSFGATAISCDTRLNPDEKSTAAINEQVHEPYRSRIHPITAAAGYWPAIALHATIHVKIN